jgi:hypothetical protein
MPLGTSSMTHGPHMTSCMCLQLLIMPGLFRLKTDSSYYFHIGQALSSSPVPTRPDFPLQLPHQLATVDWTETSPGVQTLKITLEGSSSPAVQFQGLRRYKFPAFPIPNTTVIPFAYLALSWVVPKVAEDGLIEGHARLRSDYKGCVTLTSYDSLQANKSEVSLLKTLPLGFGFGPGSQQDFQLPYVVGL